MVSTNIYLDMRNAGSGGFGWARGWGNGDCVGSHRINVGGGGGMFGGIYVSGVETGSSIEIVTT